MEAPATIGIIGHGHVGSAVHEAFRLPSYQWREEAKVLVADPAYQHTVSFGTIMLDAKDAIFLCLPTPTKDGVCDASLLKGFVKRLAVYEGLLIVKSTVPPSVVQEIITLRPRTLICPEFVRERSPDDMIYPSMIPVGCAQKNDYQAYVNLLTTRSKIVVHGLNGSSKFEWTTPVAAAYLKYYVNAFLAMKVAFTHEFKQAMGRDADEWESVAKLIAQEGRCGKTHLEAPGNHGWGFAGSCFPKDTEALLAEMPNLSILQAVINANARLKTENR